MKIAKIRRQLRAQRKTLRFVLSQKDFDRFANTLDNAPAPGKKLRALVRRQPTWATIAG